jgi:hypothetical protein
MAIVQGRGLCEIPNEKNYPCGQQINDGEPHGSVVTPQGYKQGHRRCADAFHQRKMTKERQERHDAMVKRVDTDAQGAIDWNTARDGVIGSIPLEKSPSRPSLSDMTLPEGVRPVSEVPMESEPPEAGGPSVTITEDPDVAVNQPEIVPDPDYTSWLAQEKDDRPTIPESGFMPEQFPSMAVALIPYNSGSALHPRPDPAMSITDDGWMLIETGNVRVALPDREEWDKLVAMGEALWNTHTNNNS